MKKSIDEVVLSVVIPCYNEKNSIEEIVKKVIKAPVKNKEIIIQEALNEED